MSWKQIKTVKDLERAIKNAPISHVRKCLLAIAKDFLVGEDGRLVADKDLGADFIGEVGINLLSYGFWPESYN